MFQNCDESTWYLIAYADQDRDYTGMYSSMISMQHFYHLTSNLKQSECQYVDQA
jgi:hypothetical protein